MASRIEFVQNLVCNAIAQTMGADYYPTSGTDSNKNLSALDTWKLSDVGKDMNEMNKTDVFTKTLALLLGAYILDTRLWQKEFPPVYRSRMEFGGYLLKSRLGLYEVEDDPMWDLQEKDYSADEHTPVLPKTYAKIFDELKAVRVKHTIYNDTLMEAMKDWSMMSDFVGQMEVAVENTLRQRLNVVIKQLICTGIAISDKATGTARHVVTEAIAKGLLAKNATDVDFMNSDACKIFLLNEMNKTREYMQEFTVAFNNKTTPCFTPAEDCHTLILTDTMQKLAATTATLYHDSKVDFKDYQLVNWWQGNTKTVESVEKFGDFDTISAVEISADATNKLGIGTDAYKRSKVVAFMYDDLAIGLVEKTSNKATSTYTASCDFWNIFDHYAFNAWVDSSYNMVAFILD